MSDLDFNPKDENELYDLLPEGVYPFKVLTAKPHTSQESGKKSIKLELAVKDKEITCYLTVGYLKLLKHFCDVAGLEDAYKSGGLNADMCRDKSGLCEVIIDQPKPGTKFFPKNAIGDFIKGDKAQAAAVNAGFLPAEFDNLEDLPF